GEGSGGAGDRMKANDPTIGIIGGSGLYELEGLTDVRWRRVRTPFGAPSDAYCVGRFAGRRVIFLPRHGRGHRIMPTELNFRANVWGLKALGDRKSTRLNSSHGSISYAVFCLKKKNKNIHQFVVLVNIK